MLFEKLKSQRGKDVIIYQEFLYNFDEVKNGVTRWRCKKRGCLGSIYLDGKEEIISEVAQSHLKPAQEIRKSRILHKLNRKAINGRERPNDIVIGEVSKIIENDVLIDLPNLNTISALKRVENRTIGRVTGKAFDIPENF